MPTAQSDPTFTNYTRSQAQGYLKNRLSYPKKLYETIINFHTSTGGQLDVLADIGCGPGRATRDLASAFDYAIGLDPGAEMIHAASNASQLDEGSNNMTRTGRSVVFAVCGAEKCAQGVIDALSASGSSVTGEKSVDLLTAAMAAHWFSMPDFWAEAARLVKPQGTVALWTCSSLYCHPSTPNAAAVQKALFRLEREVLAPYELPPNRLSRDMYDNLVLPWHLADDGNSLASAFPESDFVRQEWDRNGILSNGQEFFLADKDDSKGETTLDSLEASLGTASMVTRWREAHTDLAGTDKDCVKEMADEIRIAIGEQNPRFKVGNSVTLLLFKRK
ncbi:hypothetical protein UA08_03753 [Talaromyces atroroseus]|uniref:Methyltransferase type 11 domain-containing protein n=1 Tax=Talaromyces atroroseus TaxID=1441469 RepID=A0A225AR42_TALAT|nr:hypothetical protein UA08_03753 [Talaromyces atroroseus]OKL60834.1 hypothetical protein UA08_03753 [Talaromyces atroroseus]